MSSAQWGAPTWTFREGPTPRRAEGPSGQQPPISLDRSWHQRGRAGPRLAPAPDYLSGQLPGPPVAVRGHTLPPPPPSSPGRPQLPACRPRGPRVPCVPAPPGLRGPHPHFPGRPPRRASLALLRAVPTRPGWGSTSRLRFLLTPQLPGVCGDGDRRSRVWVIGKAGTSQQSVRPQRKWGGSGATRMPWRRGPG